MTRIAAFLIFLALPVGSQTLTPEQILSQVDKRVSEINPYQALLNDPDPARSLAAMQIMMESGDNTLVRLATEFGLLSPNSQVQRSALEGFLDTKPILTIRFEGAEIDQKQFNDFIRGRMYGTTTDESIGYATMALDEFNEDQQCFVWKDSKDKCAITINAEGVFLRTTDINILRAKADLNENGMLIGHASLYRIDDSVPFSIKLID